MATMQVRLVSPEKSVWEGEADQVSARTLEGDIGILAGHAPTLGVLAEGHQVRIKAAGQQIVVDVDGGFLSVTADGVTILAETAEMVSGG